ncbi:MAG TPA: hypothetical protein VG247_01625 [Pseudonocardiaceae bacterium]|jgi:hypothetical protein|nr:hypothetical protein [Pseudonocardiaceae bacterium]
MTAVAERTVGSSLITPALFDRLARRIAKDANLPTELADRILDQALAFLGACARDHDELLAPTELVDIGWHTFVLYTHDYAEFCRQIAGRFIHHTPTDENDPTASGAAARATVARTATAIEAAGFIVDRELWQFGAVAACTGCHNGCHDDPPPAHQ